MTFRAKIIELKLNEMTIDIKAVKVDYTKVRYGLSITNENNIEILKIDNVTSESIEIDVTGYKEITLNYIDENNSVFEIDTISLLYKKGGTTEPSHYEQVKEIIVDRIEENPGGDLEDIQNHTIMLRNSSFDIKARKYVENKIEQILLKEKLVEIDKVGEYKEKIYSDMYGMGILQELDDDENVSEIFVNAKMYPKFECSVYYTKTNEKKKKFEKTFNNRNELINVLSKAIAFSKKEINTLENAIIEATRANGDRVNIIVPQASENYVLNIRKFSNFVPNKENMIMSGTITEEIDEMMKLFVHGKANIGIGGEMGTGKTSFINYLLTHTDPIERKAIISSVKEVDSTMALKGHDVVVLNVDDDKGFSFENLMKASLRTTADRIIIPESRGKEFKQVYEANLKTKGNMFTGHAFDEDSFLDGCVDMYMENSKSDIGLVKNKIAKSIDVVIIMKKIDGKIRVKSISEVIMDKNGNFSGFNRFYYWNFGEDKNSEIGITKTGNIISNGLRSKLFEEGVKLEDIDRL